MHVRRALDRAEDGVAPPVAMEATHARALQKVTLADLKYHALRAQGKPCA